MKHESNDQTTWRCDKCQQELELTKVKVKYMEGNFEVDLPKCPSCHPHAANLDYVFEIKR